MRNIYDEVQNRYRILENNLRSASEIPPCNENEAVKPSDIYVQHDQASAPSQYCIESGNRNLRSEAIVEPTVSRMSIRAESACDNPVDSARLNVEEVSIESIRDVENLLNEKVLIEKIDGDIVTECEKIVSNKLSVVVEAHTNTIDEQGIRPSENTLVRKRKRFSRPTISL